MEKKTRTEYSVMNTSIAMIARLIAILMGFVTRVVFTRTLSEGYVGINGLFSDILNILSLSELGVATAITYALYEPIAKGDIKKQQILMRMFQKFYRIVAVIVLVTGLLVVPFLNILMKERPDVDHIELLYIIYLLNSVVSYLMIYKATLIDAYQLNYIRTLNQNGFLVLQDILQIIVLLTTGNFMLFLIVAVCCTITANIFISRKADNMFPFLKKTCQEHLPVEEKNDIFKNIKAMIMHKLGTIVINNTDNLLISSFVGVISAGVYSNYYLIIGSIQQIINQAFLAVGASIGNLGVTEDETKRKEIFDFLFFVGQWLYGVAGIFLLELLNPFVEIAFGKKYLFDSTIVFVLCLNFFITGIRKPALTFKESMGLFWYDRYKAIVEAVLNLVLSILLVIHFEIAGVFIGTILSGILTSTWVEPYILYKYSFHRSPVSFFIKYAMTILAMLAIWWCTHVVCHLLDNGPFLNLIYRVVVCAIIPNVILAIVYCKTREWKISIGLVKKIIQKVLGMLGK